MHSVSQQTPAPHHEQHAAFEDLLRLAVIEPAVEQCEQQISRIQDEMDRVHYLIELNMFFYESFGIPHEKRFAYRDQLLRVAFGCVPDRDEARGISSRRVWTAWNGASPQKQVADGEFSSKKD
ncbi:MAG: hypothetical protein R3C05_09265 [Pirellulaceae bacterium]